MAWGLPSLNTDTSNGLGAKLQLTAKKIDCEYSALESVLPVFLRDRVFHVTSEETFDSIVRRERIHSYPQRPFAFALGEPENSYRLKRGWVSVFDLRTASDSNVKEALVRYYFSKAFRAERTCVFLFLAENAWSSLISWKHASQEVREKEVCIPFVEAWYPGDIPLRLISDSLIVTVQSRP